MFYKRDLTKALQRFTKFPVVVVLGPRQAGKTTLVRQVFKNYTYVNLEDPDTRDFITSDPKRFLKEYENQFGLIIDEFQHAPQILSYIQIEADEKRRPGYFVLTGLQNFLMNQAITQSLAGRAGILTLLPLSINELNESNLLDDANEAMFQGNYPRLYAEDFSPRDLYPSYIHSYVERDVRQLINVENLRAFHNFLKLCAGRVGQLLNIEDLASNAGINRKTAEQWLSILEASYIIFLLKPYFKNFNKRVIKTPKLYFYDTGVACSLLGLRSAEEIALSPFRGHLFESYIVADLYKQYFNLGFEPQLYFWRDQNGRFEIDCLIDLGTKLIPLEIKSGETVSSNFFQNLEEWIDIAESDAKTGYVIYGGDLVQTRNKGHLLGWKSAGILIRNFEKL